MTADGEATVEGLTVRLATLSDYDSLLPVYAEADTLHRAALPGLFRESVEPFPSTEHIAALIDNPDSLLLVATDGDRVVGFLQARLATAPDLPIVVPRRFVFIDSMAVLSCWRRHGVGRQLLVAAEQWAQEKAATDIELTVFEFNSGARTAYEKAGYTTVQRRMAKRVHPMEG